MPDNRTKRSTRRTSEYYVEGSAVRKLETLPEEYSPKRRRRTAEDRRLQAERKRKREIAQKNRERALRLNLTYTLFLIVSVVVTVAACVVYLSLQNEILQTSEQVASLKSELLQMKMWLWKNALAVRSICRRYIKKPLMNLV